MFRRCAFSIGILTVLFWPCQAWCAGHSTVNPGIPNTGTPANAGFTGLWEYPTAEMPADGAGRFGTTQASPYAFYYIDLAWLPWLELNARLTTFDNVHIAPSWRRYMDKAIDIKAIAYRSGCFSGIRH